MKIYSNEDSSNIISYCNEMNVLNVNLNNINTDDTNFEEDVPDNIILIRLLVWHIKFEISKVLKKS